ncbi:ABC transporter ATP-binding protein [Pantoea sp. B65]|uniref:ABC transporter ATP-binding protein n=1 Tax=Pantoea sp. B65 TaxID=2813359 RepID=UPI0039B6A461
MATISLEKIVKRYDHIQAIHGIDLQINDGEFVAFVGPSGCGKSTLLRMIAGLEEISGGLLRIGDEVVNHLEPSEREIAMVFQDYALYPHMTIAENIAFGLKMKNNDPQDTRQRVDEVASMLQLTQLLARKPGQLSGGQRQRVAMGRAIIRRPRAFLFDEPLSNLDAKLRVDMRVQIKRLHALLKTTTIYVTHDQVEAMTLADRVVILREGRIEQVGTPMEVYNQPVNKFVAEFIGSPQMNMLQVEVVAHPHGPLLKFGRCEIPLKSVSAAPGSRLLMGIRPEHLEPPRFGLRNNRIPLPALADVIEPLGSDTLALCHVEGQEVTARLTPGRVSKPGDFVELSLDPTQIHLFDQQGNNVLFERPDDRISNPFLYSAEYSPLQNAHGIPQ